MAYYLNLCTQTSRPFVRSFRLQSNYPIYVSNYHAVLLLFGWFIENFRKIGKTAKSRVSWTRCDRQWRKMRMDMPRIANRSFNNNPPSERFILVWLRALLTLFVNPIRKTSSLDTVWRSLRIPKLRARLLSLILISIDLTRSTRSFRCFLIRLWSFPIPSGQTMRTQNLSPFRLCSFFVLAWAISTLFAILSGCLSDLIVYSFILSFTVIVVGIPGYFFLNPRYVLGHVSINSG